MMIEDFNKDINRTIFSLLTEQAGTAMSTGNMGVAEQR